MVLGVHNLDNIVENQVLRHVQLPDYVFFLFPVGRTRRHHDALIVLPIPLHRVGNAGAGPIEGELVVGDEGDAAAICCAARAAACA